METALADTEFAPLQELQGLDKALQTIKGELTNSLAKLSELDDHIAQEERKLEQSNDVNKFVKNDITKCLHNLTDEIAALLEVASANKNELCSQVGRIRETISHILDGDITFTDRIVSSAPWTWGYHLLNFDDHRLGHINPSPCSYLQWYTVSSPCTIGQKSLVWLDQKTA